MHNRAYSPGLLASTDRRESLIYFVATVPAVGFAHSPAGLNPLTAATLGSYEDGGLMKHRPRIPPVACWKGSTTVVG